MLKERTVSAEILQNGNFRGNIVHVSSIDDLNKVNEDSLVVLNKCPKSIAVMAMQKSKATIIVGLSETSHLMLCTDVSHPFAIIDENEMKNLPEGEQIQLNFSQSQKKTSNLSLEYRLPTQPALFVEHEQTGQKGARLIKLKELGFNVPNFQIIGYQSIMQALSLINVQEFLSDYERIRQDGSNNFVKLFVA